jgi:hypothetical protein
MSAVSPRKRAHSPNDVHVLEFPNRAGDEKVEQQPLDNTP